MRKFYQKVEDNRLDLLLQKKLSRFGVSSSDKNIGY